MDLLHSTLRGQPHPGGTPYLELTLERLIPELRDPPLPLTEANLALQTGAPFPPQPWSPTDAATYTRAQCYLNTFPVETWRQKVAYRRTESEVSILSAGELYALEGVDSRRPKPTLGTTQPDDKINAYPIVSPNPTATSPSAQKEASTPSSTRLPSISRADYPTPPTLASSPSDASPSPTPQTLPSSASNSHLLDQLVELRARAEISETRARYFEVALVQTAVALETKRTSSSRSKRAESLTVEQDRRPAKRVRLASKRYASQTRVSRPDGPTAGGPGSATSSHSSATKPPRQEVVARAWQFLANHADAPPQSPAEVHAGMARIAQLYPSAIPRPASAVVDAGPAKQPPDPESSGTALPRTVTRQSITSTNPALSSTMHH